MNVLNKYISAIACVVFLVCTQSSYATSSDNGDSINDSQYIIGPGDQLKISVWKETDMQLQVLVKPNGGITYPLIGEIRAGGMTTQELSDAIVVKMKKFIPSPIVTVSVIQANSHTIYVVGKVNRPGEYATSRYMDVLQALSLAGGLTSFADEDDIKIIRRIEGKQEVFKFDYDDVVDGSRMELNIILKAGDTVVVP